MPAVLFQTPTNGTTSPSSFPMPALKPAAPEPLLPDAPSSKTQPGFTWHETMVGTASILLWITLIDFGYLVNTTDYRFNVAHMGGHGLIYITTNLVMLLLSF